VSKTETLIQVAREVALATPDFQAIKGAGDGDRATHRFMADLRNRLIDMFGVDFSEKKICGPNSFAVDFYIPEESTIIEVALGLPNPASEFEKDILKAIMAQETGTPVSRLVFISRAGASKKCDQPGRTAIRTWAKASHRLDIEIHDLPGEPRIRKRKAKTATGEKDV
jgi:hypothetical protein